MPFFNDIQSISSPPHKKISTLAIETVLNLETENTNKKFQTSHNKKNTTTLAAKTSKPALSTN